MKVAILLVSEAIGGLVAFSLPNGLIFTVVCNFIWIRLGDEVPMPLYLIFPVVGFLAPVIFLAAFTLLISLDEVTTGILRKCRFHASGSREMKYVRRRVSAMQPISMHGELLGMKVFKCNSANRSEYFSAMLNYTVTALITSGRSSTE